jgi:hypothetical protein
MQHVKSLNSEWNPNFRGQFLISSLCSVSPTPDLSEPLGTKWIPRGEDNLIALRSSKLGIRVCSPQGVECLPLGVRVGLRLCLKDYRHLPILNNPYLRSVIT